MGGDRSDDLRRAGRAASPAAAPAPAADLPVSAEATLRVLLREVPASVASLVNGLTALGWRDVQPEAVLRFLQERPAVFGVDETGLWRVVGEPYARSGIRAVLAPVPVQRLPVESGPPLVPTEAERALSGFPEDPREQQMYLATYRAAVQARYGRRSVWIAGRGELYHYDPRCNRISGGQAAARARGHGTSWVAEVSEHEALALQRDSCSHCGPGTGSTRRR